MNINTNLKNYKLEKYPDFAKSRIIKMKSIRTLFFSFMISISYNYVFATTNNTIAPDYNYDMVISDNHPLTRDEIKNDIKYRNPSGYLSFDSQNFVDSFKLFSPTYTYVRCYTISTN